MSGRQKQAISTGSLQDPGLKYVQGSKLFFSREPYYIFKSCFKVFCRETSTSLSSLRKVEGAAGGFKVALGSRHPLISSPDVLSFHPHKGLVWDTCAHTYPRLTQNYVCTPHSIQIRSLRHGNMTACIHWNNQYKYYD